ncbi:tetratricopeptide repeat protein, partial [Vibrio cholerae]|nr:tetratricopeptide repeat protein [Vibrio cholerae]
KETKNQVSQLRKVALFLLSISLVLFLITLRRGYLIQGFQDQISELHDILFPHSRSRLSNLRMLTAKLPSSLENSNRTSEQRPLVDLL